jgi:branched-chain amino acid transport system permease protein
MIAERWLTAAVLGILLIVPVAAHLSDHPFTVTLMTKITIFAIAAAGLNIALGFGGLVSLGHAAFFGIGGYVCGILAVNARSFTPVITWPIEIAGTTQMWVIWIAAIVVSGLAALIIGALSLRTSGVYFIMVTLAFAQMVFYLAVAWPAYGGEDGLSTILRNDFPGLNTLVPIQFFAICYVALIAIMGATFALRRSHFGLALEGARQNPGRVASLGISPFRVRLLAFAISGMITGFAGALYVDLNRFVSPSMMSWQVSGELIVFLILGGIGRLSAPVVGAAIFFLFEFWLGGISDYWQFWLGIVLLMVVLFARGGVIGSLAQGRAHG